MNAHGAYTKLMTAVRHVRGYAHDSSQNLKSMFAAGPLDEDRVMVESMIDLAERFKSLEKCLQEMKSETYKMACKYVDERRDRIKKKKKVLLIGGSPTMRVRRIKEDHVF
jgi:hypothetical protein